MTVKMVLKHYSMASDGRVQIKVANENGVHSFSQTGVKGLIERDAPILKKTLGLMMVKDGDLVITAY